MRSNPRRELLFVGLVTLLYSLYDYSGYLSSYYRVTDDARQHVFWTYRFRDPELFVDDLYANFFSSLVPMGYRALYALAAQVSDPNLFSKLLPFGLFAISVFFLWKLGTHLEPRWGGLIASLLILDYSGSFTGGLPRSFALSLFIPHLYFLATGQHAKASGSLMLEALFYPQIFLNGLVLHGVTLLRTMAGSAERSVRLRFLEVRRPVGLFVATSLISGLLLSSTYLFGERDALGALITRAEASRMQEFQPGGRVAFFNPSPVEFYFHGTRSGLGWNSRLQNYTLTLALMALVLRRKMLRAPGILLDNVAVSVVLFALAHLLLFHLHLPNRYVRFTLPLSAILLIACHGRAVIERLKDWFPRFGRAWPSLARWQAGFAGLLLLLVLVGAVRAIASPDRVDPAVVELHQFLSTLPKAALIAGLSPETAGIPLLAQRRVLVSNEFALPYFKGYYHAVQRRQRALLMAWETPIPDELAQFCGEFGVTHLVVDRADGREPALRSWLEAHEVFQNERFLITKCPRPSG
ncbi:MAG: hypothetical protein ACE5JD_08935 [Candidatus Methylomirabilia bacterium]